MRLETFKFWDLVHLILDVIARYGWAFDHQGHLGLHLLHLQSMNVLWQAMKLCYAILNQILSSDSNIMLNKAWQNLIILALQNLLIIISNTIHIYCNLFAIQQAMLTNANQSSSISHRPNSEKITSIFIGVYPHHKSLDLSYMLCCWQSVFQDTGILIL